MIFQAIASTELVLRVPMSDWEMAWRCHGNVRKPRFLRIFTARILLFYPFLPILGVCFIFFWTEREWDNIMHCSWFRHISFEVIRDHVISFNFICLYNCVFWLYIPYSVGIWTVIGCPAIHMLIPWTLVAKMFPTRHGHFGYYLSTLEGLELSGSTTILGVYCLELCLCLKWPCMYIYIYACVCLCVYVRECIHPCIQTYVYTYMYTI